MRKYDVPDIIWDGNKDCEHGWGEQIIVRNYGNVGKHPTVGNQKIDAMSGNEQKGQFCLKCSAWRGQLGLEPTFQLYLTHLLSIFDEIHRVLKKTGTCWVNLGDTYATHTGKRTGQFDSSVESEINSIFTENRPMQSVSEKSLCCIPDRFKIMMVDKGWILRNTIIWYKRNCMPSSAKDRFTVDFEYVFFFTKSGKYWFEQQIIPFGELKRWGGDKIKETEHDKGQSSVPFRPGRMWHSNPDGKNMRCVWDICPKPNKEEHYAAYPTELVDRMIKAGCPQEVCNKCGKARFPIYDRKSIERYELPENDERYRPARYSGKYEQGMRYSDVKQVGYSDCGCNAGFRPGIVLDPFGGIATTGVSAKQLGRQFICIELSEKYVGMAEKRINKTFRQEVLI